MDWERGNILSQSYLTHLLKVCKGPVLAGLGHTFKCIGLQKERDRTSLMHIILRQQTQQKTSPCQAAQQGQVLWEDILQGTTGSYKVKMDARMDTIKCVLQSRMIF